MKDYSKRKIVFSLLMMSCVFSCQPNPTKEKSFPKTANEQLPNNTLSNDEIAVGWELLFDGKKMNHWRGYNRDSLPDSEWRIDDAQNLIAGKTDIISKRKFENFEMKLDYQLLEGSDSGVFYRVIEAEAYPIWFNAPEYSLLDDATYFQSKANHPNAKKHVNSGVYDILEPMEDLSLPIGKWNQVRIVIHSDFVEHWLNGERVLEFKINSDDWKNGVQQSKFKRYLNFGKSRFGHIGIQGAKSPVKFRNIKIREL